MIKAIGDIVGYDGPDIFVDGHVEDRIDDAVEDSKKGDQS